MKPFLNKVLPYLDESLYSVLHRGINENYLETNLELLLQSGTSTVNNYLDNKKIWFIPIQELAEKGLNINPNSFTLNHYNKLFFNEEPPTLKQKGMVYELERTKYCLDCLMEEFYHRLHWDISFITICTKHKRYLVDICPECGRRVTHRWLIRNQCACGAEYTRLLPKDDVSEEGLLYSQKELLDLLLGCKSPDNWKTLNEFNREDFFQIFYLFCRLVDSLPTKSTLFIREIEEEKINFKMGNSKKRNLEIMTMIADTSFHLVTNPNQKLSPLIQLIDNIQTAQNPNQKAVRLHKYGFLKQIISHPKGSLYHKVYSEYVSKLNDEYSNMRVAVKPLPFEKKYIPLYEASTQLKVSTPILKYLIKSGILKIHKTKKRGRVIRLVEKQCVDDYRRIRETMIGIIDVSHYLGIDNRSVHHLIKSGFLSPSHGPNIDGLPELYFEKEYIEQFLSSFINCSEILYHQNDDWISIKSGMYLIRNNIPDASYTDILTLVLKGELKTAIKKEVMNLKGLFVLKSDIEKYNKKCKIKRINTFGYKMSEASKLLGISVSTLSTRVKNQIIHVVTVKHNNGKISNYLSKEQVDKLIMDLNGWLEKEVKEYVLNKLG